MRRNLYHIDEMRFLIIHLILINHWELNLYFVKNTNFGLLDIFIDLTSPSLAMISGYLFFYKTKEHFDFVKKIKARFHSLIIPYVFWTLAFFLIYFIMKEAYLKIFHTTFWYGPLLSINLSNLVAIFIKPPLINFWYLQNLILIIPFNFLFYYLLKKQYVFIAFFIFIITVYAFKLFNLYFDPRFLPYYLAGCFMGYNEKHIPHIKFGRIASMIMIPVLFILATTSTNIEYSGFFQIVLKLLIVLVFLICVYNLIDSNMKSALVIYLHKNKSHSFFLFAVNMFLFSIVQRTLFRIGLDQFMSNKYFALFFVIVSYLIVLFMALTMSRFLKSKYTSFYHFITGR